jgi:cyclopropane-fatty-acyl-phospholipid synthase
LFGAQLPVRFVFWDGSAAGPTEGPGTVKVCSVDGIRRIAWAPGELGVARAFVAGDLEVEGNMFAVLRALHQGAQRDLQALRIRMLAQLISVAHPLGLLGRPPHPPLEEARPAGRLHSPARDAQVISHHYDVGNDFYRLVLGPSMTYSCARFVDDATSLEDAQEAKHELVCRKLGLDSRSGARLLDVGCGWGSLAMHAAIRHGVHVTGITLSRAQADLARQRTAEAGLQDRVEIRVQDYRNLGEERFDAISSIGMFEHVGASRMAEYFETLHGLLEPGGRLLNHAISTPGGSKIGRRTFIGRYVFPDGELIDVGEVMFAMQKAGFEVRDVESLREHYSRTLHGWVGNLEEHWDEAVAAVGPARARIWRLYMAGSANRFDDGALAVHQVLGVRPSSTGDSGMLATRRDWN